MGAWSGGAVFHFGRTDRWSSSGHWGAAAEAFGAVLAGLALFVALQQRAGDPLSADALWGCAIFAGTAGLLSVLYLVLLFVLTPSSTGSRRRRLTWKGRARWREVTFGELLPGVSILLSSVLLMVAAGL